jgi:hypothetical protein
MMLLLLLPAVVCVCAGGRGGRTAMAASTWGARGGVAVAEVVLGGELLAPASVAIDGAQAAPQGDTKPRFRGRRRTHAQSLVPAQIAWLSVTL